MTGTNGIRKRSVAKFSGHNRRTKRLEKRKTTGMINLFLNERNAPTASRKFTKIIITPEITIFVYIGIMNAGRKARKYDKELSLTLKIKSNNPT